MQYESANPASPKSRGESASETAAASTRESIGFAPRPKSEAIHTSATIENARIADGRPPHTQTYKNRIGSPAAA